MKQPGLEPYFGYGYRVDPAKSHITDRDIGAPTKVRTDPSLLSIRGIHSLLPSSQEMNKHRRPLKAMVLRSTAHPTHMVEFLGRATL